MIGFVIIIIGTHAVYMLVGWVSVMIVVFAGGGVIMPAVFIRFSWMGGRGGRKKQHNSQKNKKKHTSIND